MRHVLGTACALGGGTRGAAAAPAGNSAAVGGGKGVGEQMAMTNGFSLVWARYLLRLRSLPQRRRLRS